MAYKTVLETRKLCKYYGEGDRQVKAVDQVDLSIKEGEFVAIVGKSGSGKSTLLHLLGGLDFPTKGEVLMDGADLWQLSEKELAAFRRRKFGFIFQAYNLVDSLNVWENVVLPLGLDGQKCDKGYAMDILNTLGMADRLKHLPNALSGGQQQRAAIARALASKPAVILADEPTGNLDTKTGDEVIALLKLTAAKYGQTLVVITHNEEIAQMADRKILVEDGKVVSQ